jgi:hypothetical protein
MHVPVVFALQATMIRWDVNWLAKYSIILCTTSLVLLLSYHYLVRSTPIGALLNGRRYALAPLSPYRHADRLGRAQRRLRIAHAGYQRVDRFTAAVSCASVQPNSLVQ